MIPHPPLMIGAMPDNPTNPSSAPTNPTSNNTNAINSLLTSIMEALVKTLLERMAASPTYTPTIHKTNYDKPPIYNVQKLDKNATGAQIQDWISGVQRGNEEQLY